ncbi:biotin-dependent carboxyltransferase family protein [Ekhidna sp. To15]|uniref:5-oxoprolinase subunit C family protein n=1 Tax=Ekhidna sp. To15 TaxID=3395267 RepID=UPI003F52458D
MGKVKVIQTSPLTTIQDFGRFGYRRYGIPQSGAMDKDWMIAANQMVGNPDDFPVVEIAMMGMKLEALEASSIAAVGANIKLNGEKKAGGLTLEAGDILQIDAPDHVYAYLAIGGRITAKKDFGSVSTYPRAGFGGLCGKALLVGDVLETDDSNGEVKRITIPERNDQDVAIQIMKGPEWELLKELPGSKSFKIHGSSNRMGIRLNGKLASDYREIASSAVLPGTIQLPQNGQPIVLMNDCQTTGGYPRIGKVLDEDLGILSQVRSGERIAFKIIS